MIERGPPEPETRSRVRDTMAVWLVSAAATVTLSWTWIHTCLVPSDKRNRRRQEMRSHLWDQRQDAVTRGSFGLTTAAGILARLALGMPADVSWSLSTVWEAGPSLTPDSHAGSWWLVVKSTAARVLRGPDSTVFWSTLLLLGTSRLRSNLAEATPFPSGAADLIRLALLTLTILVIASRPSLARPLVTFTAGLVSYAPLSGWLPSPFSWGLVLICALSGLFQLVSLLTHSDEADHEGQAIRS
jgi:hypothetical protein